jgi:uncharacterized protein (TIGR02117 family)
MSGRKSAVKQIKARLHHPFSPADTAARLCLSALFLLSLLSGCSRPIKNLYPPPQSPQNKRVTVVNHGWHSGIILSRADAAEGLRVFKEFEEARYLEIGWGDEAYYQADVVTSKMTLQAALWPTDSVVQVVSIPTEPADYFSGEKSIGLELSEEGFRKLLEFVDGTFALDGNGGPIPLGKGLYGKSRFYKARGTFHFFNNCNTWTAEAIRASGFPISTFYVFTSDNLFYQLEHFKIPAVKTPAR